MSKLLLGAFATKAPLRHFLLACFALGWASLAQADIIVTPTFDPSNQVAPPDTTDYEGNFYDFSSTSPTEPITIGTFTIPAEDASTDLYVDGGIEVAACDSTSDPCAAGTTDASLVPWSHTFDAAELNNLALDFASGSLGFTAVQNSFGAVIVGTPSVDIQAVPEPSSVFSLAGGLRHSQPGAAASNPSLNTQENQGT